MWEPPYIVDDSRPPVPKDYKEQLTSLLVAGRRGDMVELFFAQVVGLPTEFVTKMRAAPFWRASEDIVHTLTYDAEIMGITHCRPSGWLLSRCARS